VVPSVIISSNNNPKRRSIMAAIKIKARGSKAASAPEPEAKPKSTRKRSAKATPKRASSTAKKETAPAKRGPGRPRKTEAEKAGPQRRNSTGVDAKLEAKLLKAVKAAGDRRRKAKIEHEESVNALYVVAQEALDAGVSMAKVSDASDISRQWLYKMGDFRQDERGGNGSTAKAKPAAKAKATPAKRTTARKGTGASTARSRTTKRGTGTKKSTATKPRRGKVSIRS
jgi:hypothetical protein